MKTKEDCPKKWISVSLYTFGIVNLYYSFNQYSTLYGVYKEYFSITNFDFHYNFLLSIQYLILCVIMIYIGVIADKYGPGFCFFVQGTLIVIGQFFVCVSVYRKVFFLMYFARILVVIGCSSIAVSKGIYCRDYFLSSHLALTNSITSLSFTLSQIANLYFVWLVHNKSGLLAVELFALTLNLVGFVIAYYIYSVDKRNNKILQLYNFKIEEQEEDQQRQQGGSMTHKDESITYLKTSESQDLIQHRNLEEGRQQDIQQTVNSTVQKKKIPFIGQFMKDLFSLKFSYWLGCFTIAFSYLSLNTYVVLGPAICQSYLQISPQESSFYVSFLPNISMIMPLIGRVVDHYKSWFNVYYFISFLSLIGTLFFINQVPIIAFSFIGLAYGTRTSAEFPLICFLVDRKIAGRAYSIARSISMLSISLILFINSFLTQKTGSYFFTLLVLLTSSILISVSITFVKYFYLKQVRSHAQNHKYTELSSHSRFNGDNQK